GLMRGREFIMKDAYSFHADVEDARREYGNMFDTYGRIFARCGLTFRPVEAGTGAIGGSLSHEFQVLASAGEDAIVSCDRCGYAANVEKAEVRPLAALAGGAGRVGLGVGVLAAASLRGMRGAVSGANRADQHVVNLDLARDVPPLAFADLRRARGGDRCPRCGDVTFAEHRGIEVGQVFLLGTKYSETMGATFLDASGAQRPIEMGCYGIGITRTVAAAIEQHHDDAGIVWPAPLAPYGALVVPVGAGDGALGETAARLAAELEAAGVDTLLDDRDERPGVKFKDADLIGLPVRLTV